MNNIHRPLDVLFGVKIDDDRRREEKTYFFGLAGHCPIALFLVMDSRQKNIIARYFNKFVNTSESNKLQEIVEKSKFKMTEQMVKQFNEPIVSNENIPLKIKPWSPPPIPDMSKIGQEPTDIYNSIMMNLHMYSSEFAKHLTMMTADYESSRESVIMTCPMSYIEFWGRYEFKEVHKALEATLKMLLLEVSYIMEKKGFNVNLNNMTFEIAEYPGFNVVSSYAW